MRHSVSLAAFRADTFSKGAPKWKIALWYMVNALLVRPACIPFMGWKIFLLRLFGAKIGRGICIKTGVNIKSPWNLTVGDDCWIGENVWIDNLDRVAIGSDVCLSQGAMLLTGNHDYTLYDMPYRNAPITIADGAWIGAQTVVCPGVSVGREAILTVGSTATHDMEAGGIYQGTPAQMIRRREIKR